MENFGETLRRAREQAGLTQAELGTLIGYSRTAVSRMESSSDPRLTPRVLRRISEVLRMPAVSLLASNREDPVNRRQLLTAAASTAALVATSESADRVGESDVVEIAQGIDDLRALDQHSGGDRLGLFARRLVHDIERLLRGRYSADMGRRLQGVLGEASVLAGWLAQDAGDTSAAIRLYGEVMAAAHLADDPLLMAHACSNLAFVTVKVDQPARAVQSAQAGQRAALHGRGGPRLRALLAAREATGHAALGDSTAAQDTARRAWRALDSGQGSDPAWVTFVTPVELAGILGHVYSRIGHHSTALRHLTDAAQMQGRPRNAISWRLGLAEGYASAGDVGQAADLGAQLMPEVLELSSTRVRQQVTSLSRALAPHSAVREVATFRQQVREAGLAA